MNLITRMGSVTFGFVSIVKVISGVARGAWRFLTWEYPDEIKPKPELVFSESECIDRIIDKPLVDEKIIGIKPKSELVFSILECISRLLDNFVIAEDITYKIDVYAMARKEDESFLLEFD